MVSRERERDKRDRNIFIENIYVVCRGNVQGVRTKI